MKTAYLNLRHGVPERRAAWHNGLERCGFNVCDVETAEAVRPKRDSDIFVSWNRHVDGGRAADRFAASGCKVLITENATWGNGFAGAHWYTVCRDYHNVRGTFPIGGPERWESLGVELAPLGGLVLQAPVVLASRGIGPIAHRQPTGWADSAARRAGARIRQHPGKAGTVADLRSDVLGASRVITWGSGAAVLALMWGIPVESHLRGWIAEQENTEASRWAMLCTLAWAQWRLEEIARGEPIARLLLVEPK